VRRERIRHDVGKRDATQLCPPGWSEDHARADQLDLPHDVDRSSLQLSHGDPYDL
jgi:hypothetical protein